MRIKSLVPVLLISSALLAGCSAAEVAAPPRGAVAVKSSAPAPAPSSSANLCESWSQLTASVSSLKSINVVSGGVASVQTAVSNITKNLDAFQAAAKGQFGPQVTNMKAALSTAQTAVQNAAANPSVSALLPLVTAVAGVGTAYNEMKSAVASRCS